MLYIYCFQLKDPDIPRRRPQFERGAAGVEAAKLKKFSAGVPENASFLGWGAGDLKLSGCPTPGDLGLSTGSSIYCFQLKGTEFDKEAA
jgi:hypothetical protein